MIFMLIAAGPLGISHAGLKLVRGRLPAFSL
jgi:hypothetical protein